MSIDGARRRTRPASPTRGRSTAQAGPAASSRSSRGREAGGPQVDLGRRAPARRATVGALVVHARVGVEACRRPRGSGPGSRRRSADTAASAAGPQRPGHAVEHRAVAVERRRPGRRPGRRRPGTARWRRRTRRRRAAPGRRPLEGGARRRVAPAPGRRTAAQMSTPTTSMPRAAEGVGVAAGPAPDVEHPHPRLQPERVDEEVDLLLGPLGERVAQVGRAQVVGDGPRTSGRGVGHARSWHPLGGPDGDRRACRLRAWTSPSPEATGRSRCASSACLPERRAPRRGPSSATPTTPRDVEAAGAEPVVLDLEALAGVTELTDAVRGADAVVFAAGAGPGSGPERKRTVDYGSAVEARSPPPRPPTSTAT